MNYDDLENDDESLVCRTIFFAGATLGTELMLLLTLSYAYYFGSYGWTSLMVSCVIFVAFVSSLYPCTDRNRSHSSSDNSRVRESVRVFSYFALFLLSSLGLGIPSILYELAPALNEGRIVIPQGYVYSDRGVYNAHIAVLMTPCAAFTVLFVIPTVLLWRCVRPACSKFWTGCCTLLSCDFDYTCSCCRLCQCCPGNGTANFARVIDDTISNDEDEDEDEENGRGDVEDGNRNGDGDQDRS
jgi:hypothetical protein